MRPFANEIKNGIIIFILIGVYFLILDALGLSDIVYLRLFNMAFVIYGVNRMLKINVSQGKITYLGNFAAAIMTSTISVVLSIIALWFYIGFVKGIEYIPDLAASVIASNYEVSLNQFCIALLIEGLASSVIVSLIVMQKWKNADAPKTV